MEFSAGADADSNSSHPPHTAFGRSLPILSCHCHRYCLTVTPCPPRTRHTLVALIARSAAATCTTFAPCRRLTPLPPQL